MPGKFQDKSGANLSGHADKWSDKNRRSTSHDAGAGSRGSRNQGTGLAGKANTMPSDAVDTSKMSADEKFKYFNSLGLNPLKNGDREPREKAFSIEDFGKDLQSTFATHPQYIQHLVNELKETPKEHFKAAAHAAFRALHEAKKKGLDLAQIAKYISKAIHNEKSAVSEAEHDHPTALSKREKAYSLETLGTELHKHFKHHPSYVAAIINALKVLPREHQQTVIHHAFDAMHDALNKHLNDEQALHYIKKSIHNQEQ